MPLVLEKIGLSVIYMCVGVGVGVCVGGERERERERESKYGKTFFVKIKIRFFS
jgi:hypothetical protein